jgi:hypothetical protein
MRHRIAAAWLLTALCAAPRAIAQDATGAGSISGIVSDERHAPAASVAVCVTETRRCAVTDQNGGSS